MKLPGTLFILLLPSLPSSWSFSPQGHCHSHTRSTCSSSIGRKWQVHAIRHHTLSSSSWNQYEQRHLKPLSLSMRRRSRTTDTREANGVKLNLSAETGTPKNHGNHLQNFTEVSILHTQSTFTYKSARL